MVKVKREWGYIYKCRFKTSNMIFLYLPSYSLLFGNRMYFFLFAHFRMTMAPSRLTGMNQWLHSPGIDSVCPLGWSGCAMVLGKLPVPGRPTNLDYSRARAYCACSRWGWFGHFFFSRLSFLFSFSLFGRRSDID